MLTRKQNAAGRTHSISSTSEARVPVKHLNASHYGPRTTWQNGSVSLKTVRGPSLLGSENVISANGDLGDEDRLLSQFCCKIRFSSSSAERSKNAADSRYPATSCLTALISVGLSWGLELELLEDPELGASCLFMLRSVGPREMVTESEHSFHSGTLNISIIRC